DGREAGVGEAAREEHPRLEEGRQGRETEEKSCDDAVRRYALAEDQEAEGVPTVYDRRLVIKEISVGDITSQQPLCDGGIRAFVALQRGDHYGEIKENRDEAQDDKR